MKNSKTSVAKEALILDQTSLVFIFLPTFINKDWQ